MADQAEVTSTPPKPAFTPPYETGCPGCGNQFHFKEPLKDWTTVFCGRCGFVRVR